MIIYASCLISEKKTEKLFGNRGTYEGFQVQKFHKLLSEGLEKNNCKIKILSIIPVTRKNLKKLYVPRENEYINNIEYIYPGVINIPILKNVFAILSSFWTTWNLIKESKEPTVLIADCLNQSVALGSVLAAKVLNTPSIGIVTDLPEILSEKKSNINNKIIGLFEKYILLTKQMGDYIESKITHKKKPYIVIEGMVDYKTKNIDILKSEEKYKTKVCMYTGALEKKYGLDYLVKGFIKADVKDSELHIYGNGSYRKELLEICKNNKNVKYFGTRPNKNIIEYQRKATLLINVRPSSEEFTKYSFPSKNMEYMASGTPFLTTILPGMPKEYLEYVYTLQQEDEDGVAAKLEEILNKPYQELYEYGRKAKLFVVQNKNNISQAKKILDWLG